MADDPLILLTNDDGIESPGFEALRDGLESVGEVVPVAPADDRSAIGRALSSEVAVDERDGGYAIHGTPADCVVAGLEALVPDADLVVSGINKGANLGAYVLGRSGTVSAAVEAAFFGVPAIAVSQYIAIGEDVSFGAYDTTADTYETAVDATRYLAEHAVDAGVFEHADFLNVNAPAPDEETGEMVVTHPSTVYDMDAERNGGTITLHDRIWERMASGDVPDPEDTDRWAVVNGHVSVSALTAPHEIERHDALDALAETYDGRS